jgi:hypothetical protein
MRPEERREKQKHGKSAKEEEEIKMKGGKDQKGHGPETKKEKAKDPVKSQQAKEIGPEPNC